MKKAVSTILFLAMAFATTVASAETVYLTVGKNGSYWTNTYWYEYTTNREYASPKGFTNSDIDEMRMIYDQGQNVSQSNRNWSWWRVSTQSYVDNCSRYEGTWWMQNQTVAGSACWEDAGIENTDYRESKDRWADYSYKENGYYYYKYYHLYGWY